jgi:hypothetical protein
LLSLLAIPSWATLVAATTQEFVLTWRSCRYEGTLCDRSLDLEAATAVARYTTVPHGTQGTYQNLSCVSYCILSLVVALLHGTPSCCTPFPASLPYSPPGPCYLAFLNISLAFPHWKTCDAGEAGKRDHGRTGCCMRVCLDRHTRRHLCYRCTSALVITLLFTLRLLYFVCVSRFQ